MTKAKRKNQYTPANRQLAQAFHFSTADLAATRAGFVTDGQSGNLLSLERAISRCNG